MYNVTFLDYDKNNYKMSSILLYHHLGLGDHIMCHGIVREYCKKYEKVAIFCLPHNLPTVSFMFRDLANLTILKADSSYPKKFTDQKISQFEKLNYDEIKIIGYQNLNKDGNTPLEMQFYQLAGIPFNKKWDSFYVERDSEKERALFDRVVPRGDYAFVHEDAPRNFVINKEFICKDCAVIIADQSHTDNIIDYCTVIEKAKEIHVIDSCFMFLIDFLPYNNPDQKLFVHRYSRENHEWLLPVLKKDWHIIIQRNDNEGPLKAILRILLGNNNTIIRKIVRRIYKKMKWDMIRPCSPDLNALIKRYVYRRSFLEITIAEKERGYLSIAREAGATTANTMLAEGANPADIVFYSGQFSHEQDLGALLEKLHAVTKSYLIFHTKNCTPEYLEEMLTQAGFETREKHLFPFEVCFVCKVVSENGVL